ncbi:MAG: TonB-dependent receptor [Verrucomicrobia bacterium]|nr:TonB-dependent receptor [Verrucomicrobiota bacterium]
MNSNHPGLRSLLLAAVAACPATVLLAAAPPASTTPPTRTEEAVELSPFVVTELTERGYAATNTLEGSRLNTALRDTPGAISVFTRDLLDDLAATSLDDILRYDLNADLPVGGDDPGGGGSQVNMFGDQGTLFNVRGLPGTSSIDGFQNAGQPNTYNIERVGSTRGPNAILFGTGSAGGNLNFRTRAANLTRTVTNLDLKVAGESTKRAALDVNRMLLRDRLALRLMSVWDRKGSPSPHQYTDIQAVTLAAKFRFRRDTELSVSYERSHTEGVTGRPWNHVDTLTRFVSGLKAGQLRWNQALERYENANGTALVNATAGTGNLGSRTVLVYGPDLAVPPLFWEGASATANRVTLSSAASLFNSTENLIINEEYEPYGAVTSTGAGEFAGLSTNNFTATFNHRWFSHLFMELAYNRNERHSDTMVGQNPDIRADLNYRLPDGSLNPYFFGNGYYFSQQNFLRLQRENDTDTFRASFSYELDFGRRWGLHRFAVMGERSVNQESRYRSREVWANRPYNASAENAANQVFRRRYFRIGGPFAHYTAGYQPGNPTNTESYRSSFATIGALTTDWAPPNDRNFDDEITTHSSLAVMQNFMFDRRLVTTFGVRDDTITASGPRVVRDAATGKYRLATAADRAVFTPLKQDWFSETTAGGIRRSLGAVYHATRNFSFTANYSNSVGLGERNRSALPDDLTPPPYKGEGYDYGIAFSFLDNRLSGSIKNYESKMLGDRIQGGAPVFVNPNNDVMSSFDYYFRQAGLTNLGSGAPVSNLSDLTSLYFSTADSYLSDRVSKGTEVEIFANPTRNWTLRAGYSYTDRTRTNVFNEGVPWWAERVALWKSLDAFYTARTGRPSIYNQLLYDRNQAFGTITVAQRIAQSDAELANIRLSEEQAYGNRPHKANLWTRYSFSSGPLRGLSVGGGWRYQSANVAGVILTTKRTLWGNPRSLGDLFLQYRTKGLAGLWTEAARVTYQLNVTNVLDDRTINATKLDEDTVTGVVFYRRAFREDPRVFAFTLRMEY